VRFKTLRLWKVSLLYRAIKQSFKAILKAENNGELTEEQMMAQMMGFSTFDTTKVMFINLWYTL
jgi:hypothetical protein